MRHHRRQHVEEGHVEQCEQNRVAELTQRIQRRELGKVGGDVPEAPREDNPAGGVLKTRERLDDDRGIGLTGRHRQQQGDQREHRQHDELNPEREAAELGDEKDHGCPVDGVPQELSKSAALARHPMRLKHRGAAEGHPPYQRRFQVGPIPEMDHR